jgi:LPS-assembly protein
MRKLVVLLLLMFSGLVSASQNVEVFATSVDSNETHLSASNDVVVLYGDQYLSANKIVYEKNSTLLELFGNITVLKGSSYHIVGEYARLVMKEDDRLFEPFFLLEKNLNVWMSTKKASSQKNLITLEKGMVSGCNPANPLWKLRFGSADYDDVSKWMNIYHASLLLYDVPVFYFPYFGYSLDFKRRTGLLIPSFGISSSEGFYYEQPVYVAEESDWDLELAPQVRTNRGAGLYATLRFVDSEVSQGHLTVGYFKERSSYLEEFDLANNRHYGFDFNYINQNWLKTILDVDASGQSGMYSDVIWMNDIDYLNLKGNDETKYSTSNQLYSRINTFYNNESDYYGLYFKYFVDLSRQSNDETIQSLPVFHYHHYIDALFKDYLFYSLNANFTNQYRKAGKNAFQSELDLPVTLRKSFFDDYLDLSYTMQLHARHIFFSGEDVIPDPNNKYGNGVFARNYHSFRAESALTKKYEDFSHVMTLNASYVNGGSDYKSGYYEEAEVTCSRDYIFSNPFCDYYDIVDIEEEAAVGITQFFFNRTGEQLLYHKLSQTLRNELNSDSLGALENELDLRLNEWFSFYNDMLYNHDEAQVTKFLSALRYNGKTVALDLTHLHENDIEISSEKSSYLIFDASYQHSDRYKYFTKMAYDFENAVKKHFEAGFLYSRRCWDFGVRYVENNRPILTNSDAASIFDKYIYFTIALKPIGGTDVSYKLSNSLEGS